MTTSTSAYKWPDYLSPIDAADYLGVTEGTVRRWLRDGVCPFSKPGGKTKSRILIRRTDLDALINAGYVRATSGPLADGGGR